MIERTSNGRTVLQKAKAKVCGTCQKGFKNLPELKQHIKIHNRFLCSICKHKHRKEFKTLSELRKHMKIHEQLGDCPDCSCKILYSEMKRHRQTEHGVVVTNICRFCGHMDKSYSNVLKHERQVHLKEKNVSCPNCDMNFFNMSDLDRHMVRHDPVKKFECKFCKKTFARNSTLQLHEKIHTGDKKVVCYVCGERFVQKASLNYHMSKHHPDKVLQKAFI